MINRILFSILFFLYIFLIAKIAAATIHAQASGLHIAMSLIIFYILGMISIPVFNLIDRLTKK